MTTTVPAALIRRHREINIHDDWHEGVYEDFTKRMSKIGVHVRNIYYSGFSSQGDGACFEGHIEDWGKYLYSIGEANSILAATANDHWAFCWTHTGRYYHHKSVSFDDSGVYFPESPYAEDDLRHDVWMANMMQCDLLRLSSDITEDLERHMKALYRQLEEEYEELTSDDTVAESIIANDLLTEEEDN
jgi:hypothetical protein